MERREDYYLFSHYILPYNVFKLKGMMIKNISKDKLCAGLIRSWDSIKTENGVNSQSPNFEMNVKDMKNGKSLIIIKMPEAKETQETPFIGITYDENFDDIRYFVFEIAANLYGKSGFFLCEWSKELNHINHKFYKNLLNVKEFYNAVIEAY